MINIALFNVEAKIAVEIASMFEELSQILDKEMFTYEVDGIHKLMLDEKHYSLILFDCSSKKDTIIEVSKDVLRKYKGSALVLISHDIEDYLKAFEIGAARYFNYPLNKDVFMSHLTMLIRDIKESDEIFYLDHYGQNGVMVHEIYYCIAQDRSVHFHTKHGLKVSRDTFSQWHTRFENHALVMCSRGILVNLDYIKEVKNTVIILKDNTEVPVSRRLRTSVLSKLKLHRI